MIVGVVNPPDPSTWYLELVAVQLKVRPLLHLGCSFLREEIFQKRRFQHIESTYLPNAAGGAAEIHHYLLYSTTLLSRGGVGFVLSI